MGCSVMCRTSQLLSFCILVLTLSSALSFSVSTPKHTISRKTIETFHGSKTRVMMGFRLGDDDNIPKLTRENEPEDFFATNLDKLSDKEKIPIAVAGFLGISLPFVAGLIFLYLYK